MDYECPANQTTWLGRLKFSLPLYATHFLNTVSWIVTELSFEWPLSTTDIMGDKRIVFIGDKFNNYCFITPSFSGHFSVSGAIILHATN